jgi:lactate permease
MKGVWGITLASGLAFALPQVFVARYLGAELPALIGSIASLGVTIFMAKRRRQNEQAMAGEKTVSMREGLLAWLPYILIFAFVILSSPLFPGIHKSMTMVKSSVQIYTGPGAMPTTMKWIATPGALIILATLIGGRIQGASFQKMFSVLAGTMKQLSKSAITVVSIVAMAKIMGYSGMIASIAVVLVQVTGGFFPALAPMIGMLGTFVTGSDTSSNILFGALQMEVAGSIHVNPYWLAAANTAGATAGKMISPQSIAVATSATGLIGSEGKIFNSTVKFCIGYVSLLGILVFAGSLFF